VLGLADGLGRAGVKLAAVQAKAPKEVGRMLDTLILSAVQTAPDANAPLARRVRAITLLGHAGFEQAKATLPPLLNPMEPQPVHLAAVRALANHREPEVAVLLLHPWRGYTPALRSEVIQILLGRSIWVGPLLDAIEAETVTVGQVPPARRKLLLESSDAALRARARALFGPDATDSRADVIARYTAALSLAADRDQGRKVFERECLGCHRVGAVGQAVGPNLSSVQHRTADEVLISILDPNREVAPEFLEYAVALKDGRVVTGLIDSETESSLTLKRAQGAEDTILRQNIEEIASTGKSLMPEGLEKQVTPQEMADLLAFVLELQQ